MYKSLFLFFSCAALAQQPLHSVDLDTLIPIPEIVIFTKAPKQTSNNKIVYTPQKNTLSLQAKGDQVLKSIPFLYQLDNTYEYQGKKTKIYINGNEDLGGELIQQIPYEAIRSIEVIPNGGAEHSSSENIVLIQVWLYPDFTARFFQEAQLDLGGQTNNNTSSSSTIFSGSRWLLHFPVKYHHSQHEINTHNTNPKQDWETSSTTLQANTNVSLLPSFNLNFSNASVATTAYYINQQQNNKNTEYSTTSTVNSIYAVSTTYTQEINPYQKFQLKGIGFKNNLDYSQEAVTTTVSNTTVSIKTEFSSQQDTVRRLALDYTLGYHFSYEKNHFITQNTANYQIYKHQIYLTNHIKLTDQLVLALNLNATAYQRDFKERQRRTFFLPTTTLTYNGLIYSYSLAYAYRTILPNYMQLDEREQSIDGFIYTQGNSNLKEERKHNTALTMTRDIFNDHSHISWKSSITLTKQAITLQSIPQPNAEKFLVQYRNDGICRDYTSSLSFFTILQKRWLLQFSYSIQYIDNKENKGYSHNYSLYTRYKITPKLVVELQSSFQSKEYHLNYTITTKSPTFYVNLNQAIGSCFFVEISTTNPFNLGNQNQRAYSNLDQSETLTLSNQKMSNIFLTLAYRFGKEKNVNTSSYE